MRAVRLLHVMVALWAMLALTPESPAQTTGTITPATKPVPNVTVVGAPSPASLPATLEEHVAASFALPSGTGPLLVEAAKRKLKREGKGTVKAILAAALPRAGGRIAFLPYLLHVLTDAIGAKQRSEPERVFYTHFQEYFRRVQQQISGRSLAEWLQFKDRHAKKGSKGGPTLSTLLETGASFSDFSASQSLPLGFAGQKAIAAVLIPHLVADLKALGTYSGPNFVDNPLKLTTLIGSGAGIALFLKFGFTQGKVGGQIGAAITGGAGQAKDGFTSIFNQIAQEFHQAKAKANLVNRGLDDIARARAEHGFVNRALSETSDDVVDLVVRGPVNKIDDVVKVADKGISRLGKIGKGLKRFVKNIGKFAKKIGKGILKAFKWVKNLASKLIAKIGAKVGVKVATATLKVLGMGILMFLPDLVDSIMRIVDAVKTEEAEKNLRAMAAGRNIDTDLRAKWAPDGEAIAGGCWSWCPMGMHSSLKKTTCVPDCPEGTDNVGGGCYKDCAAGFEASGSQCRQPCPEGFVAAGLNCARNAHVVPKPSYSRGAGRRLSTCPPGSERDGALCYPRCRPGYDGRGPMCWQRCPYGFADSGVSCRKPASYGRGVGYPIGDKARCERENGGTWRPGFLTPQQQQLLSRMPARFRAAMAARMAKPGGREACEQSGALHYPKCKPNFHAVGCCVCSPNCPAGHPDQGAFCGKGSYGRGAGTPLACGGNEEQNGGLCYRKCQMGYHGNGPVCWGTCPPGYADNGGVCAKHAKTFTPKQTARSLLAQQETPRQPRQGNCVPDDIRANHRTGILSYLLKMMVGDPADRKAGYTGGGLVTLPPDILPSASRRTPVASRMGGSKPAPAAAPRAAAPKPPAVPTIVVVRGSYGRNCRRPDGNVTGHLARTCNGRASCRYRVNHHVIGDPAPGCAKSYRAEWRCGKGPKVHITGAPSEASGKTIVLSCAPAAAVAAKAVVARPSRPPLHAIYVETPRAAPHSKYYYSSRPAAEAAKYGWRQLGVAFRVPRGQVPGTAPTYVETPAASPHSRYYYSTRAEAVAKRYGWRRLGVAWYAYPKRAPGTVAIYLETPARAPHTKYYLSTRPEAQAKRYGFKRLGVAFYAYP